jgi:hypothetical protein
MRSNTYPDNYVELLVHNPADPEYGKQLAPGETPPGGWSIDGTRITREEIGRLRAAGEDKRPIIWQGQKCWKTQHGQATIAWHLESPGRAWNVLLPDGRRAKALRGWWFPVLWRRTADTLPLKYQWGKLDIREDDVTFTDVPTPSYEPPVFEDKPNLEMDLAKDSAFVAELADVKFALAVWSLLYPNCRVRLDGEENGEYLGRDRAAWLVAGLRGLGEDTSDFKFWDATVPNVELYALRDKVSAHLLRLGWRRPG